MKTRSLAFAVIACFSISPAAFAGGKLRPKILVAERAERVTNDATARFTCELRAFTGSLLHCYGPDAIRAAYGVNALLAAGFDGKGETIVIIEAFGSPTLEADLDLFDATFALPAPPSVRQIRMPGTPPFDVNDDEQVGWALETSLDVQWAHAIAPGAKIVVVAAKSSDDGDVLDAQNYAIKHRLGHVISESFGESELDVSRRTLRGFEMSYHQARERRMSVLVSAGDEGATNFDAEGNLKSFRNVSYPASSPHVTGVGGTNLFFGTADHADPNGTYQGEVVWNEEDLGIGATGGGVSARFREPIYQIEALRSLRSTLKGFRGVPDVGYNAGVRGGVIIATTFTGAKAFFLAGGTSAGAPQWAGIVAITNQIADRPLGFLNPRLYFLGRIGALAPLTHDITIGDNSFAGVDGFSAGVGYDLTTGWGTPNLGVVSLLLSSGDVDDDDCDMDGRN
ncbi:MAG TPA: S53 family peptidase [Vicinamibacterales bacterium]|nr:S53 family peptidase [Vicinamibacterales bacterium]